MERIQILINRLKEQLEQKASPSQMLVTVQLLQNELTQVQFSGQHTLGTSKVAVVLPRSFNFSVEEVMEATATATATVAPEKPVVAIPEFAKPEKVLVAEEKEVAAYMPRNGSPRKNEQANLLFDPMLEIPTLSHQQNTKEINETGVLSESLNDRLKQGNTEVAEVLKHEPIKDLRKAIGINDRFVFISDLFRGDEAMYERSIKTINSFNIFPEAEYWINRELIVKLGWDAENEIVRHFYQLVKRRFS